MPSRVTSSRLAAAVAFCALLSAPALSDKRDEKSEKMKQRLEQLFIWRVSDRLNLEPKQEVKFASEYKRLAAARQQAMQKLEATLSQIEASKGNPKKLSQLLQTHKAQQKDLSRLQMEELDVMEKLFEPQRFAEYILLKREMTQKYRDVLTQGPGGTPQGGLKEPEVIEEN